MTEEETQRVYEQVETILTSREGRVLDLGNPEPLTSLANSARRLCAYGCGKWREVERGYGGWAQRWQGAVRGLVRALEPAVGQSGDLFPIIVPRRV